MSALFRLRRVLPPLHSHFMAAIPVDPQQELERLERRHAENPEGRYFVPLADAYRRSGRLSGAIDLLRAGLARHPDYLSAHVVLGRCYADLGESEAAEAEFRHVLALDPQNLIALRTLGDIALFDGRRREAERWYQDLLAVDPMNDDARAAIAHLSEEGAGAFDDAEAQIVGAEDEIASSSIAGVGAGQPAPEMHELEDGVADMDSRSEDDRGTPFDDDSDVVITETIAELYTRQGFYDRAAGVYRELIRRRGGDGSLEARLRRVEALAAGLPDPGIAEAASDARVSDEHATTGESPIAVPGADDAGDEAVDPFYPLIGPVGDTTDDGAGEAPEAEEAEAYVVPAYDFASPIQDEPGPDEGGYEDLDDLLIDPFLHPWGSTLPAAGSDLSVDVFVSEETASGDSEEIASHASEETALHASEETASHASEEIASDAPIGDAFGGGLLQDPFADSFAEGFPSLQADEPPPADEPLPIVGIADLSDADTPSEAGSAGLTIGSFLRSLSSWRRAASIADAAASIPGESAEEATEEAAAEIDLTSSESSGGWADLRVAVPPLEVDRGQWEDAAFDSALGHTPTDSPTGGNQEVVPAEPSGADDLQLVDPDDLFPWELPAPEPASDLSPSVEPLALDSGYPFDEVPQGESRSVDEIASAERIPSSAVDPDRAAGDDQSVPQAPEADDGLETVESGLPFLDDEEQTVGETPATPASAQDDDDLESFQAWLRSLKR